MITLLDGAEEVEIGNIDSYECHVHPPGRRWIVSNRVVTGWFCLPENAIPHLLAYEAPEGAEEGKVRRTIELLFERRMREELQPLRKERE